MSSDLGRLTNLDCCGNSKATPAWLHHSKKINTIFSKMGENEKNGTFDREATLGRGDDPRAVRLQLLI